MKSLFSESINFFFSSQYRIFIIELDKRHRHLNIVAIHRKMI